MPDRIVEVGRDWQATFVDALMPVLDATKSIAALQLLFIYEVDGKAVMGKVQLSKTDLAREVLAQMASQVALDQLEPIDAASRIIPQQHKPQ